MTTKATYKVIIETIKEMKEAGLSKSFIRQEVLEMFSGIITKEEVYEILY
tara:strand:- start:342 stop:491 length:150 start_codon:yes stop_codon:yes gene_type:complete